MKTDKTVSAFIIAGGKSSRFGQDKTLYLYKGKPLIEHVLSVLVTVFSDIAIVTNETEKFQYLNLPLYTDIIPDAGPIGGLHSALKNSRTERIFICASDLPYIRPEPIQYMISVAAEFDIVVPYINNYYEALHAIYSKNCVNRIEKHIKESNNKVINLYQHFQLRTVAEDEIGEYIVADHTFRNINYAVDLE